MPKKEKEKTVMGCSCGYTDKKNTSANLKEEAKNQKKEVEIATEDDSHLPLTDVQCPKCEHTKAHYWLVQTRAGDEPETKFLKCENCKHQWRDYS
jgi:transcription factor S